MVKNLPAMKRVSGDAGLIPGLGRSLEKRNDNPLQDACLGNPMDREAWPMLHHQLNGHEFEQTRGKSIGQWSLVCCSSQACKELDTIQ